MLLLLNFNLWGHNWSRENESFVLFQDGVAEHYLVMVGDGGEHFHYCREAHLSVCVSVVGGQIVRVRNGHNTE